MDRNYLTASQTVPYHGGRPAISGIFQAEVILFDEMEFEIKNWDSLGSLRIGSNVTIGNNFLPNV